MCVCGWVKKLVCKCICVNCVYVCVSWNAGYVGMCRCRCHRGVCSVRCVLQHLYLQVINSGDTKQPVAVEMEGCLIVWGWGRRGNYVSTHFPLAVQAPKVRELAWQLGMLG